MWIKRCLSCKEIIYLKKNDAITTARIRNITIYALVNQLEALNIHFSAIPLDSGMLCALARCPGHTQTQRRMWDSI